MKIGSKVATICSPKSKTQNNNVCTSHTFTFYYANSPKKQQCCKNQTASQKEENPNFKTAKNFNDINFFASVP